jgi:hypothetical protein
MSPTADALDLVYYLVKADSDIGRDSVILTGYVIVEADVVVAEVAG